jgi:hypothetical protein
LILPSTRSVVHSSLRMQKLDVISLRTALPIEELILDPPPRGP